MSSYHCVRVEHVYISLPAQSSLRSRSLEFFGYIAIHHFLSQKKRIKFQCHMSLKISVSHFTSTVHFWCVNFKHCFHSRPFPICHPSCIFHAQWHLHHRTGTIGSTARNIFAGQVFLRCPVCIRTCPQEMLIYSYQTSINVYQLLSTSNVLQPSSGKPLLKSWSGSKKSLLQFPSVTLIPHPRGCSNCKQNVTHKIGTTCL